MRPSSVYVSKLTSRQISKVTLVNAELENRPTLFRSPVHELQDKAALGLDNEPAMLESPIVKWPRSLRLAFVVSSSVLLWVVIGYLFSRLAN